MHFYLFIFTLYTSSSSKPKNIVFNTLHNWETKFIPRRNRLKKENHCWELLGDTSTNFQVQNY